MASRTKAWLRSGQTIPPATTTSTTLTSRSGHGRLSIVLALLAGTFILRPCLAQTAPLQPIVEQVRFAGDLQFSPDLLQSRIRTAPNRRFLGISGLHWWLWLYRVGESNVLGQRAGRALMALGEPPAWLDMDVLAADIEKLRLFYEREGFRSALIGTRVDTVVTGDRVSITFEIHPGRATTVRRVSYIGLDSLSAVHQTQLVKGSLLEHEVDEPLLSYRARPQRFSEIRLIEERRRLLSELRTMGYAAATRDSVTAIVTPVAGDSFDVQLRLRPGARYRFGTVHFEVEGPEAPGEVYTDTLHDNAGVQEAASRMITFRIDGESHLNRQFLTRALRMHPGQWYNQAEIRATKRRLESTGIFTFTDIVSLVPTASTLPHRISVRTRPRHQFRLETFVLQSSGVLGGVGNELGVGLGLTYENANLFGSGEVLQLSGTGSVAADVDTTFFSSSIAEFAASVSVPYLAAPFHGLEDAFSLYQARTRFTLSYLTARREDLSLIIRGRGAARLRLEMRHSPTLASLFDLLDLSLSQPDTLRGFQSRFLDRVLGEGDTLLVIDPVQRAQILEDYTQPQINNAVRYTLRAERVNPLRRDDGYSYEVAFEVGGNLPYVLDRYAFTPGELEGYLRLFAFAESQVNYRQYIRLVGDLRHYQRLGRSRTLALKFVGGWAHPFGQASVVPFDRRFYSGGASSVRGWHLRELGPGTASFRQGTAGSGAATNLLGGDIKLEASIELRQTAVRNILGADWILAAFTDAGNVWFGSRHPGFADMPLGDPTGHFKFRRILQETGVGSGVGLRGSWAYLVVRFDLALRVYDPAVPEVGMFPDGLRQWIAYFRLGHTF